MGDHAAGPVASMCWNQRITAIPTSTWREISGQEQQERMHVTERETMVKIRLAIIFIIAQVVLTKYTSRRLETK